MSKLPNKNRIEAIEKLKKMINYPGRFPILVIGDTGVGKNHWIKTVIENEAKDFKKIRYIKSGLAKDSEEFWESKLKEAYNHYLIINDIDKLSKVSQDILFECLSTHNGMYGLKEKKYIIRIILTTTYPIEKIRDDRRHLNSKFFDRISQFVVEFPNFQKTQRNIYKDFIATWNKFFNTVDEYKNIPPKSTEFKQWLEANAYRLHGNFRDLDKIVINWNLHQLSFDKPENNENKIFTLVKNDFERYLHNPSTKIYEENTFILDEDSNYQTMLNDFRKKVKTWAIALYGDKFKAAKKLGISARTMERWN